MYVLYHRLTNPADLTNFRLRDTYFELVRRADVRRTNTQR
jgi:hypothetical protein